MASATVSRVQLPGSAVGLATLHRVDYRDAFHLEGASLPARSGEDWARQTFERASAGMPAVLRGGWFALGLKLKPGGDRGSVLGWRLRHSGPDFALLALESRVGMPAELLFKPQDGGLLFATFVQHDNAFARVLWAIAGPVHRRLIPHLLGRAAARAVA